MSGNPLPQVLDLDFYRFHCSEASKLSDELALAHYKTTGIQEGFIGSPAAERGYLLSFIGKDDPVLEIGPFHAPSVVGEQVRYMDVLATDQLIDAVREAGHDTSRVPKIHYVAPKGGFDMVGRKFAAVFSGHCIEHQPDLIRHLQGVSGILDEGGRYYIACPDKRFCFDHFAPVSGIADILTAYHAKRVVHQSRSFIVQRVHRAHNEGDRHWAGDHGPQQYEGYSDPVSEIYRDIPNDDAYHDTHAWQFTPTSFFDLMTFLYRVGLIDLAPERVYHTRRGSQEFTAVLKKGKISPPQGETCFVRPDVADKNSITIIDYNNAIDGLESTRYIFNVVQEELKSAREELTGAKEELAQVYASRSWRVTGPLRRMTAVLRLIRR